jgi:membrane fusion protein (multidrug efflux system)
MTSMTANSRKPRSPYAWWRWTLLVAGAILVFALIYIFPLGMMLTAGFPAPPPSVVSTVVAENQPWQPSTGVVGTLTASVGADLAAEVAGVVEEVYYDSGGSVEAGAPLVRLRSTDENARLRTLEASAQLAEATYSRSQRLLEIQGISTAQVEASEAELAAARAQVAEQRAIIEKKMIRAPFAGELGIRQVNVGQYVNPGTVVATLQALDPIHMDFTVPQQMLQILKVGQPVAIRVDAYPNDTFIGEIATIDPKVEEATRNIAVRAIITNSDKRLLPGMFATAEIETGGEISYITVPQTSVTFNPYGSTVYVVSEVTEGETTRLVATQTFVTTGETRGDQIAILTGIEPGTTIVSAGQFKLQNGATIAVNNEVQPSNEPNPRPLER